MDKLEITEHLFVANKLMMAKQTVYEKGPLSEDMTCGYIVSVCFLF